MQQSKRKSCKQRALVLDIYKEPFKLLMPDGSDKYRTSCGAILSCLTLIILMSYAIFKLQSLLENKNFRVQESGRFEFYAQTYPFGHDQGFAFAAGLIEWDGGGINAIEDPAYGEIKFFVKSFGENAPYDDTFHELKTHFCQKSEFNDVHGTRDDVSNFYRTSQNAIDDIGRHVNRLRCLDNPEDLQIWGNYDTGSAANILVVLDKCDPLNSAVTCKSEEEIQEWLRFKYILTTSNSKRFV